MKFLSGIIVIGEIIQAISLLLIWEAIAIMGFVLVIATNVVSYPIWIPALAIRSQRRFVRYGIPFQKTWDEGFYLGSSYNSDDTVKKNAQELILNPVKNTFSHIKELCCS